MFLSMFLLLILRLEKCVSHKSQIKLKQEFFQTVGLHHLDFNETVKRHTDESYK